MKRFVTIVLLSFHFLYAFSQGTQTIRGVVTDKDSKYPLTGVVVVTVDLPTQISAITNESGEYTLENVPLGRHTLMFKYLGYEDLQLPNIVLTAGKEVIFNVSMIEKINLNEEVVVTAEKDKTATNNEFATVSARSFNLEDAARYAGSLNDPARMASNFAGVSGVNDGRNDIIIRGNSPVGLLWRLEGTEIPNPNHFGSFGTTGGPVSMLNSNLLDKSDFLTGAFPAQYGNAVSGVFDLQMRNGNNQKHEFLGQVGFNGLEFGAEGPFSKKSKASFLINYRYSTLGIFKAIGVDFGTGASVPQYQDLSFKIDLPTQKAGRFSLFGVMGTAYIELLDSKKDTTKKDAVNLFQDEAKDTYFQADMLVTGVSHKYFFNPSTYSNLVISFSGTKNIARQDTVVPKVLSVVPEYGNRFVQDKWTLNYSINKKFSARNTAIVGIIADRQGISFEDSALSRKTFAFETIRNTKGQTYFFRSFAQWQHKFTEKLTFNTGVHYLYYELNQKQAIEPRVGMSYQLNEKQRLSAGLGLHNQTQPMLVYFTQTPSTGLLTNKNLDFTRSYQAILAYDYSFRPDMRLKVETYYQYLDQVPVDTKPSYFSMLNFGSDFNYPQIDSLKNAGTGQNYGVEITLEKFYTKGFYFLSTTSLFQSTYTGSNGIEKNTIFNGNYITNLLVGKEIKVGKKGTISADVKLTIAGGKRFIPIDFDASSQQKKAVYKEDETYNNRLPDYFRTDLKIGYQRDYKRMTLSWSVNIQNLTNQQNVFLERYSRETYSVKYMYQLGLNVVPQFRMTF